MKIIHWKIRKFIQKVLLEYWFIKRSEVVKEIVVFEKGYYFMENYYIKISLKILKFLVFKV